MKIDKRIGLSLVAATIAFSTYTAPVSAQRYCQRELADETREEGCTAPVGGPIGTVRLRGSSTVASDEVDDSHADLLALVEEATADPQ